MPYIKHGKMDKDAIYIFTDRAVQIVCQDGTGLVATMEKCKQAVRSSSVYGYQLLYQRKFRLVQVLNLGYTYLIHNAHRCPVPWTHLPKHYHDPCIRTGHFYILLIVVSLYLSHNSQKLRKKATPS